MGMDLIPINPASNAPRKPDGRARYCFYSWSSWKELRELLAQWGVPLHEFRERNHGEVISEETCLLVAAAIEKNVELIEDESLRERLCSSIERWRTSGGYEQW